MKRIAAVVGALVLASLLTACGSNRGRITLTAAFSDVSDLAK